MRILFIISGDINLPTGGYRYDREIISAWKNSGVDIELISLEGNYPLPGKEEEIHAIESINNFQEADLAIVDGLLGGGSPEFLEALSKKLPVVALIHHPLCLENGLDKSTARFLEEREKQGLEFVSKVITTSPATSRTVASLFEFNPELIHTVLPGVERGRKSIRNINTDNNPCINLLCVGSVIERKGHKDLLLSLSTLQHLDWHLDCIGSTQFDQPLFQELIAIVKQETLGKKVKFHGTVNEDVLENAYEKTSIFVLPSLFEGYGMAYAEAIVRGIPVIGTTAGAIPQTVPDNCGILVEPSNTSLLAQALEKLITNENLRAKYRNGAIAEEPNFPTWESAAGQFAEILKELS